MSETLKTRSRMDAIQVPIVAVVGEWIRQTPGTISLGQGVVHYGPPQPALIAVQEALTDPGTHEYQDGAGVPPLVNALTAKLRTENGIDTARGSRIMVTAGANMAFMHAVLAVTEPGDEVILPVPFYFNHEMAIQMAGCRAVLVPTDARYQLKPDAIRAAITDRTRAVVTISPNNPSGAVFSETALREVHALCGDGGRTYCEPYVRKLAEIRHIVLGALGRLAPLAEVPPADGAFYCLLKVNVPDQLIRGEGAPSVAMVLAERLIREHKVAVIPGPAFGMTEGCYFRVAYGALQKETVAEAIGRLVKGLRAILG